MVNEPVTFERWIAVTFPEDAHARKRRLPLLPATQIAYITHLLEEPETSLHDFTDEQITQGLWNGLGLKLLEDSHVGWPGRQRAIRAIGQFYRKLFATRCAPTLSHLDEPGATPLNGICYMWFDIFSRARPKDPTYRDVDQEYLSLMQDILTIPHDACRESAIHGLGHWYLYYPQQVRRILDAFQEGHPELRPELKSYLAAARVGYVE